VTLKAIAATLRKQVQDPEDDTDKATISSVLTEIQTILEARERGQDQPPPATGAQE
jgi:hypothetical protein